MRKMQTKAQKRLDRYVYMGFEEKYLNRIQQVFDEIMN